MLVPSAFGRRSPFVMLAVLVLLVAPGPRLSRSQGPPAAKVVASPVVSDEIQEKTDLIGDVEPWRESTVAAEVSGKVETLEVRRGMKVRKGWVLARLGLSDLSFKIEEARARKKATAFRLDKAKDLLERSEKMIRGRGIPEREHTQTELTMRELEENLAAAEAEISRLEDELSKKAVKAPFDGVVTRELTEVGEWVEQGGGIVHIVDFSNVRVLVDMPEKYIVGVKAGDQVTVKFDALGNRVFKGKVHALIPYGNKDSHTFPLEVHVKNPELTIKGGMLARVQLDLGLRRMALMIPKDAVITRGSRTYLFIVHEGKAKQVFVTTNLSKGDRVEVRGPVQEGEMVIIRGNERVRDGQPVQVVPLSDSASRPSSK